MRSKYANIGGVAVNYFHTGPSTLPGTVPALDQGALLLFLHGAGSNAHTWHRQVEHFGRAHSAVAVDFPGHGRSGSTEGLGGIEVYANFTAAFVEALRLRPAVVVGRGMGGAVAVAFALAHPQRVRALILVGTPARFEIPADSLDTWHNVTRGRAPQPFSPDLFSPKTEFGIMREVWTEQVQTDPRVRYFDLMGCRDVDLTARAARISVPTLVISGRDDRFATPERAEALQRAIAGAQLVIVEDAGHALTSEQPGRFNEAVAGFLAAL